MLTEQQVSLVKQAAADFIGTSMYGRVIGYSPSHADISDLLKARLLLEDSHIEEVALMGWGIFWLKLSSVRAASDMPRRSPVTIYGKIILLVPWYRGFSVTDFNARFNIPYHLVTLQFPGLAAKLQPIITHLGAHFS